MADDGGRSLDEMMQQIAGQAEAARESQSKLKEISSTATSPRRMVTVTAGHGGAIHSISFEGSGYKRMAPAELSRAVLETVREAQDGALEEAVDIIAPTMPVGFDARRLLRGETDLVDLMPMRPPGDHDEHVLGRAVS